MSLSLSLTVPRLAIDPFLILGEARDGAVLEDGLARRPGAGQLLDLAPPALWLLLVACVEISVSERFVSSTWQLPLLEQ